MDGRIGDTLGVPSIFELAHSKGDLSRAPEQISTSTTSRLTRRRKMIREQGSAVGNLGKRRNPKKPTPDTLLGVFMPQL